MFLKAPQPNPVFAHGLEWVSKPSYTSLALKRFDIHGRYQLNDQDLVHLLPKDRIARFNDNHGRVAVFYQRLHRGSI